MSSLLEIINRLDEYFDDDPFHPLAIFAEDGVDSKPTARAIVCPEDEAGTLVCPNDHNLSYVLGVGLAIEAIEVWSNWREGSKPSPMERFSAVMFYAANDAYMPVEGVE